MEKIESHFDDMYRLFSSEDFLQRKGVSTEVPFFICHYKAEEQVKADGVAKLLHEKLNNSGIKALHIDLYQLMIEKMKEMGVLEMFIERESKIRRERLLKDLRAITDPRTVVVPEISNRIKEANPRIVFLTGIGSCYPIISASVLLENLKDFVATVPLIMFFPGRYEQSSGNGSSLHIFGGIGGRGYYRAYDVETFIDMNKKNVQ